MSNDSRLVERLGANDLMQLASDVGPVPMHIGAVMILQPGRDFDITAARALLGRRISRIPRLRQRLVRPPIGCGRPYWIDDASFDVTQHVRVITCAAPGDEDVLLATALRVVARRMPRSRPMWSATFVTGLPDGRVGIVVVLHHVIVDGSGSLALLHEMMDNSAIRPDPAGDHQVPSPSPTTHALFVDAWSARFRGVATLPRSLRRLGAGLTELGAARARWAPRTSLNQTTGSGREASVARTELAAVVEIAHRYGGTVNDVVLTAVIGALGSLLCARGESVSRLVVSVPVTAHPDSPRDRMGNGVGAVPMELPTAGDPLTRLESIVAITKVRKQQMPGASAAVLEPVFRALAGMGAFGWFINHQRLVNTFVTNVRGPAEPLTFAGTRVDELLPLAGISGNVTAGFAVLSYAGNLTITITTDPQAVPDLRKLTKSLQEELDALTTPDVRTQPA